MGFTVFIPTAGTGSRLGVLTRDINKSLLSIGTRPILSFSIDQFPFNAKFVIALGHQGHLVKSFLMLAYPQHHFVFVEIDPFEGPGSSLGYTVWNCRSHLQDPFIFCSNDTLTTTKIPAPDHNWMGVALNHGTRGYRSVTSQEGKVTGIHEKEQGPLHAQPYIGLAGIKDTDLFWEAMQKAGPEELLMGESLGLRALLGQGISVYPMDWHDTGNPQALERARDFFKSESQPHILEKSGEAIWFVDHSVIKYSKDKEFIRKRVLRAGLLQGYCPPITASTPHMYRYQKIEGEVLSDIITVDLMQDLLAHLKEFWKPYDLGKEQQAAFERSCFAFYHDKTYERIERFYRVTGRRDGCESINSRSMPLLKELLEKIDWQKIPQGRAARFHGDCHFENMIYEKKIKRFTFLDCRQDFAGELEFGDVYYDLAKLYHGLIVSHEEVFNNRFSISWAKDDIQYFISRKDVHLDCEKELLAFLERNKFDPYKVRVLTALVFLNIAALHHHPYNEFLYCLGKDMLCQLS